jgi:hypothetical protein
MTIENIKKMIRHNQFVVVAAVICVGLTIYGLGCQVTTENPFNPEEEVTRDELRIEAEAYAAKLELAFQDLDKKDAIVKAILEAGLAYAQGGGVNPIGLASTMLGILGMGAVVDNRRKDAVIKSKTNALKSINVEAAATVEVS